VLNKNLITRVAGVVVLYNPYLNIFDNIKTYINQVDKLFVIDNSDKINNFLVEKIQLKNKAEYINNPSNLGIAAALNVGARKAIGDGFEYLLTMDQDSKATTDMVKSLLKIMQSFDNIGIVTAEHINFPFQEQTEIKFTKEIIYTMTSGNLLNLSAYKKAGAFLEKLFIDHVDHEYCLRLKKNGFKIIKTNEAVVYHNVGDAIRKKFFNFIFCPTNHPPLRLYYRTRNRFYIDRFYKRIFPEYVKEDRRNFIRELIEIIFYENNLLEKIKMMIVGYLDYRNNILGKYKESKETG